MTDELGEKIKQLKSELEKVSINDSEAKENINALIHELEQSDPDKGNDDIVNNVKRSIARFETEHPRITNILNDIMVTLSNIGI